jgi:hypothetical protein
MSKNIKFYLNPPSPKQESTKCHLPPVNSLLVLPSIETNLPRLCLGIPSPSLSSCSSLLEPYSSSNTTSPSLSPFMSALSLVDSLPSPQTSPRPAFLLPLPTRCRSLSNASNNSSSSTTLSDPSIDNTNIKRKRGRPPNSISKTKQHDNWTFVTPTICNIKQQNIQQLTDKQKQEEEDDFTVLHWPTSNKNQSSSFITNAIPRKKRGRKPKVQVAGNFCFIWRDLTARRGANKKKKSL